MTATASKVLEAPTALDGCASLRSSLRCGPYVGSLAERGGPFHSHPTAPLPPQPIRSVALLHRSSLARCCLATRARQRAPLHPLEITKSRPFSYRSSATFRLVPAWDPSKNGRHRATQGGVKRLV